MPFTIGGEWIPEPTPVQHKQPVKVIKEKRRGSFVTVIINLPKSKDELKHICSDLKQHLACGGSVKDDRIELQGDQVDLAKKWLKESGLIK